MFRRAATTTTTRENDPFLVNGLSDEIDGDTTTVPHATHFTICRLVLSFQLTKKSLCDSNSFSAVQPHPYFIDSARFIRFERSHPCVHGIQVLEKGSRLTRTSASILMGKSPKIAPRFGPRREAQKASLTLPGKRRTRRAACRHNAS